MKLKAWRKSRKLNMVEAVKVLGISQSSISRIERGRQWPDKDTVQKIVDRTDGQVTPDDLWDSHQSNRQSELRESAA